MQQMFDLRQSRVLVVGGSSGIGQAAAEAAVAAGAQVTIAGRSPDRLAAAALALGGRTETQQLDITNDADVEAFFAGAGAFDHIVVSAAQTKVASVKDLSLMDAYQSMQSKFWGAYRVARAAPLRRHGSLTLVSGYLSIRPKKGAALQGAINAALEGLTRGLALELAPGRVNAVSPGLVDTPLHAAMGNDARRSMYERAAAHLPAGLVGQPKYIATQILAFMANPFITGSVVYVDGGGSIA
jgi:NAD(P)-dependent dehydrogenase (short-subunit alcohol dehydrogenase family)